ncbi:MAG: 30S ribosomal protein S8 [bacterium]
MVTDPVSDFITRIKMAGASNKEVVTLPYSKLIDAIATVLVAEGYLKSVSKKKKNARTFDVEIAYKDGKPKITGAVRVSKPSKRVYEKAGNLNLFKSGFGRTILSTPRGILTNRQAVKEKAGGEVLFKIW